MNASTQYLVHSATPLLFPLIAVIGAALRSVGRPGRRLEIWQRWWLACTNLGFAVLALVLVFRHREFRLPFGIAYAIFLWGAAFGHLDQWFAHGDHQPGNTGGILIVDIAVPAVIIALALADRRRAGSTPAPAPAGPGSAAPALRRGAGAR